MALILSKTNILTGNTIQASDVSQSIDALTGAVAYDITISGSTTFTGSVRSLNGYTGSLLGTASQADTVTVTSSISTTSLAIALLNTTQSNNAAVRFDNDNLKYTPSTNTLTVANITASLFGTASYASSTLPATSVQGTYYPSGSASQPSSSLKFLAGSSKTATNTVAINISELSGKTLGQTCFVTATPSGSNGVANTIVVNSLVGNSLTFESQIPNTDFYYNIIYI
jgi:hypothetical protein